MAPNQVPISRRSGRQTCQSLVSDASGSSPDDEEFDTAPFPNNSAVPQNITRVASTPELGDAGGRVTRLRSTLMGALKKAIEETEHGSLVKVVCPEMDSVADSGLAGGEGGLGESGEVREILELQTPAVVGSGLDAGENISDCGQGRPLENTLGLPGAIEPSYDPKGDRFWELTPLRRLSVGRRQNREFVDIYDYQELPDGGKVLGGEGITLDIADWRALCSALPEIRGYLLDKNLETKESKESKGGEKDVQPSLNAEAQKIIPKRSLRSNSGRVAQDVQQTECLLQKVLETPMKPKNPSKTPKKSKLNPPSTDKIEDVVAIKVSNNLCLKDKSINTAAPGVGQPKTPRRKSHRIAGKLSLSQKKRALEDEELEANAVPKKAKKRVRWKTRVELKIIGQDLVSTGLMKKA